tara:strand:- start:206 stop:727 length:522 start_codon:yes stop_codon:yes gene_type:complete
MKDNSLSRKHTIFHLLARYIKSPDLIKYIYGYLIHIEMKEESFFRLNMNIFHLLGGKYWSAYTIKTPPLNLLMTKNIFIDKLPLNKTFEWFIKNENTLSPYFKQKNLLMEQIKILGTPGLFITDNKITPKKKIIKFMNDVMITNNDEWPIEYTYYDLYEDYEFYLESGIPILI